jgi:hypothetical protein
LVALCRRHYESNTAMPLWDRLARLIEEDGQEIERWKGERETFRKGWNEEVDRRQKAEARVSELEQALEELGEAHRLLAAQGLMAACADEGKDQ